MAHTKRLKTLDDILDAAKKPKSIGEMAAALSGNVTAVVCTGGMSSSEMLLHMIKRSAGFVADFLVYPGMEEMNALATAAIETLRGNVLANTCEPPANR